MGFKRLRQLVIYVSLCVMCLITVKTVIDFRSPYGDFLAVQGDVGSFQHQNESLPQILDVHGDPLTFTYQNSWNIHERVCLRDIPELLQAAFVFAEDKRFHYHYGVDFLARIHAIWLHVAHKGTHRGASTITEQIVKMLHPRPRTVWSKWLEGIEAIALEFKFGKPEILEFYLNQVSYVSNRRGIKSAARYYFNRDLSTLSLKEMLALVVLVRAPSAFDLYKNEHLLFNKIEKLAAGLYAINVISNLDYANIKKTSLFLEKPILSVDSRHFVKYVRGCSVSANVFSDKVQTTLDSGLQKKVNDILDVSLESLRAHKVNNAAALIVDHTTNRILSWVSTGIDCEKSNFQQDACQIDMVMSRRQAGSVLKPFLYATALDLGLTPATIIEDSPHIAPVGQGMHHFHNCSRIFYGNVTLRQALGNSLNIPALRVINIIGIDRYFDVLKMLGFDGLDMPTSFYSEGLALGNGEVSLYEVVKAYTVLANGGVLKPLQIDSNQQIYGTKTKIFSTEATSIIGNILSDPWARNFEFGSHGLFHFPIQTAVKTGTSNDYRDAWAVGFNYKYVVGIWMGNANRKSMERVGGASGPAFALRSIFKELNAQEDTHALFLSDKLIQYDVCTARNPVSGVSTNVPGCIAAQTEYFITSNILGANQNNQGIEEKRIKFNINIVYPADGVSFALDPRIPREKQAFEFVLSGISPDNEVEWFLNDQKIAKVRSEKYLWHMERGKYTVHAVVWDKDQKIFVTPYNKFTVK
ncbi:Penicillin-binding protein 1C [Alphaproteobacteria bacterium]